MGKQRQDPAKETEKLRESYVASQKSRRKKVFLGKRVIDSLAVD